METNTSTLPFTILDVPVPVTPPDYNRRLLLQMGAPKPKLEQLYGFSPSDFEAFVYELVHGYLKEQYIQVSLLAGAGDKGRDIAAYTANSQVWDLYQCKHYSNPLAPNEFWVELGKLVYHTFTGAYHTPRCYYLITSRGIGPTLHDLLRNPEKFNELLLNSWDDKCKTGVTAGGIEMTPALEAYIKTFDFGIVKEIPALKLIDMHEQTQYHAFRFGGGLKPRPEPEAPPETIEAWENNYIHSMYEAFADHLACEVTALTTPEDFGHDEELTVTFQQGRESFYSAESLKEFARDNLASEADREFDKLLGETNQGLRMLLAKRHDSGFKALVAALERVLNLPYSNSLLHLEISVLDRMGFCHHLANRQVIRWVKK